MNPESKIPLDNQREPCGFRSGPNAGNLLPASQKLKKYWQENKKTKHMQSLALKAFPLFCSKGISFGAQYLPHDLSLFYQTQGLYDFPVGPARICLKHCNVVLILASVRKSRK